MGLPVRRKTIVYPARNYRHSCTFRDFLRRQIQRLLRGGIPVVNDCRHNDGLLRGFHFLQHVNQSLIAIGSGGFSGKGYLSGTQTTYGFVPEQSTDFIFCTVGEEWGFLGCLALIALYVSLIWLITKDAEHSRESFTRIYGYCLASCLFMHLFINIGMTIGIMPVIGIPLPFMSYGGSSLWAFTIMLSIFIALDHREKRYF